jgi:5-formyltetrahydrofolate cyclo-ligase
MQKSDLRKKYNTLRASLSHKEINLFSNKILSNLLDFNIWDYNFFHVFLTMKDKKEIDTSLIINELWKQNKLISTSVSDFKNNSLSNYRITSNTEIKINTWGIPEPYKAQKIDDKEIDVVFVPLLAFDSRGYRVGYGKGFYDRFLANCREDVVKIGISFFETEDKIDDIHNADIKLNYCITPQNIYTF